MRLIAQSEATECGLACVAMVSDHYGLRADLSWFRQTFDTSARGSTIATLHAISTRLGFNSQALKIDAGDAHYLRFPCIAHWEMKHFVVLKRVTRRHAVVYDPALGIRKLTLARFAASFTGVVLQMVPSPTFRAKEQRSKVRIRDLIGKVYGIRTSFLHVFAFSGYLELCALALPLVTKWLMDGVLPSRDFPLFYSLVLAYVLIQVTKSASQYCRGKALIHLTSELSVQWGGNMMTRLLSLPLPYFEKRGLGDLTSRFNSYATIVRTLGASAIESMLDCALALFALLALAFLSPVIAGVAMFFFLVYVAVRVLLHSHMRDAQRDAISANARVTSHLVETLRGIHTIRLNGGETKRQESYYRLLANETNGNIRIQQLTTVFTAASGLILGLKDVGVSAVGIYLVLEGQFTIGTYVAAVAYAAAFSSRGNNFLDKINDIKLLRVHAERIADITQHEAEFKDGVQYEDAPERQHSPSLEFVDVCFRYSNEDPLILRNVSFKIGAGESVAITGASGIGKTTLMKLILGVYMPTSGQILIDGVPLQQFGVQNLRAMAGTVLQNDELFAGSIRENIAFFSDTVDIVRVERAARLAAIHDDIMQMPMKYLTPIGDMGSTVSGGQKQRLILARALYREPDLLLLDEATSHLDIGNEHAVNTAMRQTRATKVVIAHRQETIAQSDRAIDMKCFA